jgi:flagellar basal-body rod protein FlgC
MNVAMSAALSGLLASSARLNATASNVANADTTGPIPATPPTQPLPLGGPRVGPQVYQAITTLQTALPDGGVSTSYAPVLPSYVREYAPEAPYANAQGLVAAPNVDMTQETVHEVTAKQGFEANLAVIRAVDDMESSLLKLRAD